MEKIKKILTLLPPWILTVLTTALILWLTLSPQPLGPEPPALFPGADKIAHALMFGFLTAMVCLDMQRSRGWRRLKPTATVVAATAASVFGIAIEVAQLAMAMGRGFEVADMVADAAGAFATAWGWNLLQGYWCRKS